MLKNKNNAIVKAKELNTPIITDSPGLNGIINPKDNFKKYFAYQSHYFLVYWDNDVPFFDIQHVISVLNLKKGYHVEMYNKYVKEIINYIWHENEYSGYILRELINEKTMFKILMNSNSDISKSFKNDVSDILCNMRKDGELVITNNKICVKKLKKHENIDSNNDSLIINNINEHEPLSYDNIFDMYRLHQLVNQMTYIPLTSFIGQSVLYAFVIALKRSHKYVVVKFGWTEDILKRIGELQSKFACNIYLIGLKKVRNEKVEHNLHKTLKLKFPNNIEDIETKGKKSIEEYKFDMLMMSEFNATEEDFSVNIQNVVLSSEQQVLVNILKNQEVIFRNSIMSQLNLNKIINQSSDALTVVNCAKQHYDFLKYHTNIIHTETLKRLELDAIHNSEKIKYETYKLEQEYKLKLKDKEIELKKLELKLLKRKKK